VRDVVARFTQEGKHGGAGRGIDCDEFMTMTNQLRLERFWTDQILYRL
jgi:hypothetical protein